MEINHRSFFTETIAALHGDRQDNQIRPPEDQSIHRKVFRASQVRWTMMTDMMPGMMWGMALLWLLVAIALILATAALVEYLRSGDKAAPRWGRSW
jgi:hypothetical protein